jgi:hypothetical protein
VGRTPISPGGTTWTNYVYQFEDGIYIKPPYEGDEAVTAVFTAGEKAVTIQNIPDALEDVAVTITYGTGRDAVTVAKAVSPVDGVVTMDEAYDESQSYTVKVSSSNFADITVK